MGLTDARGAGAGAGAKVKPGMGIDPGTGALMGVMGGGGGSIGDITTPVRVRERVTLSPSLSPQVTVKPLPVKPYMSPSATFEQRLTYQRPETRNVGQEIGGIQGGGRGGSIGTTAFLSSPSLSNTSFSPSNSTSTVSTRPHALSDDVPTFLDGQHIDAFFLLLGERERLLQWRRAIEEQEVVAKEKLLEASHDALKRIKVEEGGALERTAQRQKAVEERIEATRVQKEERVAREKEQLQAFRNALQARQKQCDAEEEERREAYRRWHVEHAKREQVYMKRMEELHQRAQVLLPHHNTIRVDRRVGLRKRLSIDLALRDIQQLNTHNLPSAQELRYV